MSKDKKVYNIILETSVKEKIDKIAKQEDRSASNLINFILKRFVEEYALKDLDTPLTDIKSEISNIQAQLNKHLDGDELDTNKVMDLNKKLDDLILDYYNSKDNGDSK